jgi:hypothetical protein
LKYTVYVALLLSGLLLVAGCGGCRRSKTTDRSREAGGEFAAAQHHDDMLLYAIDNLNRLEDFDSGDSLFELLQRFDPRNEPKPGQPERQIDPLLAAWPEPEMFREVVDRLNQWVHGQQPPAGWKVDPMTASLPKPLRELPQVKNLALMEFTSFDGFALLEAAWFRDVSLWAKGDGPEDLDVARSVFDWTIRNIQLERDYANRIPQFPRETLLLGRGTAADRAWVFILLLRQLDIDAAVLAIDEGRGARDEGRGARDEGRLHPWCVGVLIEGQVYLFDTLRGLPIPAPHGITLDESDRLAIRPATLAQVVADQKLLDRMEYDESRPYGIKAADLKRVTALLEASPPYLACSMRAIQSQLSGARKMTLSTLPEESAKRWKDAHIDDVLLWRLPYETLDRRAHLDWRTSGLWLQYIVPLYVGYQEKQAARAKAATKDPLEKDLLEKQGTSEGPRGPQVITHAAPLYKARVLYLKGKFTGDEGAIHYFYIARPSHQSIAMSSDDEIEKQIKVRAKQDASYWLGLTAYQLGNYQSAVECFLKYTLEAYPNGLWTVGARYNLARTYEAQAETGRAALLYGSNAISPGYDGDLLRAKWLRELGEKGKPEK